MTGFSVRHTITVEEYLALSRKNADVRYEYIDGYVSIVAEGTTSHANVASNSKHILQNLLQDSEYEVLAVERRVHLSERRYVYPDITVINKGSQEERELMGVEIACNPRLVVEILSAESESYDRGEKFAHYRNCATVQEYLLIASDYPRIDLFRHEKNRLWTLHEYNLEDEVSLVSLGIHFPVRSVYEKMVFSEEDCERA